MPLAYYAVELRHASRDRASPHSGGTWSPSAPGRADRTGSSGCCWRSTSSRRLVYRISTRTLSMPSAGCRLRAMSGPDCFSWSLLKSPRSSSISRRVLYFGASRWFTLGPIAVQASRILLYLLYFFVGAGIGAVAFDQGVLAADGRLARRWPAMARRHRRDLWPAIMGLIYIKHAVLPDLDHRPLWWEIAYALAFVAFSAAQTLFNDSGAVPALLQSKARAFSIRMPRQRLWHLPDPLRPGAVAAILRCTIFVRAGDAAGAIIKATIVFVLTLASAGRQPPLAQAPGATHVLVAGIKPASAIREVCPRLAHEGHPMGLSAILIATALSLTMLVAVSELP